MIYRELKTEIDKLTDEQLDMEVIVSAEERGGKPNGLWIATEDMIEDDEGVSPRSEMIKGDPDNAETYLRAAVVCRAGQPIIDMD